MINIFIKIINYIYIYIRYFYMQARVDPLTGGIVFDKIIVETGVTYFLESARK